MRVLFFGTPPFAARTLDYLLEQGVEIVGVVTRPDKPVGRSGKLQPPAVKRLAMEKAPTLPIFQPKRASAPEIVAEFEKLDADLFIVVAYGQIVKENVLEMPPKGCINVHASLLPKYRGAAPIQRSIMEGEKETGVTIMHMALELDAGDMIRKGVVEIGDKTYGELERALCEVGCETLLQTIQDLDSGKATRTPQNHEEATYAHKITPGDGEITFQHHAEEELQRIRGVTPKPGAWCQVVLRGKPLRMKIKKAVFSRLSGAPGETMAYGKSEWIVACKSGALSLLEVQLEGKRPMSAEEFMRGYPKEVISLK